MESSLSEREWLAPESSPEVIQKIVDIGLQRLPREACGILLPFGVVIELHNEHSNPTHAFAINNVEMLRKFADWLDATYIPQSVQQVNMVVWHTHPSGLVGPSDGDLEIQKIYIDGGYNIPQLVVSLPDGIATRY